MPDANEVRKTYRQLLATLEEIDQRYLSEQRHISSADDIADGYRMVFHTLQSAIDLFLESDPHRPQFKRLLSPSRKHTGDNPDVVYYHAIISGEHELRIRGQRAGESYLSFTVYGSRDGVWSENVTSEINHTGMQFDAHGRYEIVLSRTPPQASASNWLPLADDSFQVVSRHYYENPEPAGSEPFPEARPVLERAHTHGPLPRKDAATIQASMEQMIRYLRKITLEKLDIGGTGMPDWFSHIPNTMGQPRMWEQSDGGGNGTGYIAYAAGFFMLQPGEALIIDGRMPDCAHGSVVVTNRYLQSLDYRERRICLNRSNMITDGDGRFRVVVAAEDPGVPNWLHTEGRPGGIVYWRFMLPEGKIEPLRSRVASMDTLRKEAAL